MSINHATIKITGERGYASEWNADHVIEDDTITDDMVENIGAGKINSDSEIVFYDPFKRTTLGTEWNTTQKTASGIVDMDYIGGLYGQRYTLTLRSSDTAGAKASARLGDDDVINPSSDFEITFTIHFESRYKLEAGLIAAATSPGTGNQKGAYIRAMNEAFVCVTGTGAAETTTGFTCTEDDVIFRIRKIGTSVYFYKNNMAIPIATHTTNLPASNATIKFSTMETGGDGTTIQIDYVALKTAKLEIP